MFIIHINFIDGFIAKFYQKFKRNITLVLQKLSIKWKS